MHLCVRVLLILVLEGSIASPNPQKQPSPLPQRGYYPIIYLNVLNKICMVLASRGTQVRRMKTACTFSGRPGKVGAVELLSRLAGEALG